MKKFIPNRSSKKSEKSNDSTPKPLILTEEYKNTVCSASYLGKRGYTIPKSVLTNEDQEFLKKDLFLKPETPGAVSYGPPGANDDTAFPVYRESDKKLYIPRFYGIERYGYPPRSEIDPGIDISVPFVKPLRDYQEKIVDAYLDAAYRGSEPSGGILQIFTGAGKTIMALKICSIIGKKTLILIHKEFLADQWIERIREFMPSANIGRIQGQTLDIEGKDIVLGMIQTMYNRAFPQEVYSQFGFLICDETHHMASCQFSKTLLKCIFPYCLGVSATVSRKDKLTRLLHMFLGPMIYSMEREKTDIVSVYGIEYRTGDADFNETELDFRGTPKYSTMISKLCDYGPRRDFIVRVIEDLIKENPKEQMIVLAHNRSLLTALYDMIQYRGFATCGYYLGGMKQKDLKESESKQVIIATYGIAQEALDIKSLSILVLATPKTDVIQCVGRILRMKHENPIVVDIVDTHSIFQNQWTQRKRYYKKCNYRIRYTNSNEYNGVDYDNLENNWLKINDPKSGTVLKDLCKNNEEDITLNSTIFGGKCLLNTAELFGGVKN